MIDDCIVKKNGFCTKITSHQNTVFTPHYHFPFCKYRQKEANDLFLYISIDGDKSYTLWLGVVSHALSDVIVYFGAKQKTRRQNELDKITSTVLAASSSVLSSLGPCFLFCFVFILKVCLPDSFFSTIKACFLLYRGGVRFRVPWGVCLLILTKLCSDAGFGSFTPEWTLTLNLGLDGKQTLLWPCNSLFLFTFTTLGLFQESGMVTIVMASFKLPWR